MNPTTDNSAPLDPAADPKKSFANSDNPCIVLKLLKGRRLGWPVSALSEYVLQPGAETVDGVSLDKLVFTVGLRRVTVRGISLGAICDVFDQGAGGTIIERGERFAVLAARSGRVPPPVYVATIKVESADDSMPGEDDDGNAPE